MTTTTTTTTWGQLDCKLWADQGCVNNPRFMLSECRIECIAAIPWGHAPEHDCAEWAAEHECTKNPGFMHLHCADACGHQWRWVPEVRRELQLPPLEKVPRILTAPGGTEVDALKAARWQLETLEQLILNGVVPVDVQVPEDGRSLSRGVLQTLLYAGRLIKDREITDFALAGLVDDSDRRDWAFRLLPESILNLRRSIDSFSDDGELMIKPKRRGMIQEEQQLGFVVLASSGTRMPVLGLGTCWLTEDETEEAVNAMLEYLRQHPEHPGVHVDTAEAYRNEAAIGRALTGSSERSRVFLGSKLSDDRWLSYEGAINRVDESLRLLQVSSIDLYTLHSPFGYRGTNRAAIREAWRGLVSCVHTGKVRALGLSNFDDEDLREFLTDPHLGQLHMPEVLQNKFDPFRHGEQNSRPGDGDPVLLAKQSNIAVVAYSSLSGWPFGFGALADPIVNQLAVHSNVTPATLVLRWVLASGNAIIPRSKDSIHVRRNLDVLTDLPVLPPAAKDVLDGLVFLAAHASNHPNPGAFDSLTVFPDAPATGNEL